MARSSQDERDGGWRLARPIADLAIPDTVQGVIVARIDRLEESVKSVLKLASVIGRSFFLRILKAIAEAADDVEQGLGRLEAAELVRLRQQLPEIEYIFKHALVQEAAYGSILAERRRTIHRSVARAIESAVCRSARRIREPARLPLRARRGLGRRRKAISSRPATRPAAWPPMPRRWSTTGRPRQLHEGRRP